MVKWNTSYNHYGTLLFIFLSAALVHSPGLFNGYILNWDDSSYILNNPFLKDFSWQGFVAIFTNTYFKNYHPLTTLTYWLQYNLISTAPWHFHLINILLHASSAVVLYRLINALFSSGRMALLVAMLFAVHPMHTESVAWVSERKDVLYLFFYLSALSSFVQFKKQKSQRRHMFRVLIFFILSLLSKPAAITLPFALALVDSHLSQRTFIQSLKQIKWMLLPVAVILLVVVVLQLPEDFTDKISGMLFLQGILTTSYSFAFYTLMSALPIGQSAYHPMPEGAILLLSPLVMLLLIWVLYQFSKQHKVLAFGVLFFLLHILLYLKFLPLGDVVMAERYTYAAYIGLYILMAYYICRLLDRAITFKRMIYTTVAFLFIALSIQSAHRTTCWSDGVTLFSKAIELYPTSYKVYAIRANGYEKVGKLMHAYDDYSRCIVLNPYYAKAYNNRALVLFKLKRITEACKDIDTALLLGYPVKSNVLQYCAIVKSQQISAKAP